MQAPAQTDKDSAPRLILDLNSILVGALLGGKDPDAIVSLEDGEVKSFNSALYGVEKFFAAFAQTLQQFNATPRNVIGVWDGKRAKAFRQGFLPGYKHSTRSPGEYEQLNQARQMVTQRLRDLGATSVSCSGCEADDVIAYLVQKLRTRRNIVVTGDGDLAVLVDENTDVWRRGRLNENPYGPFPHKYITVYKALVGDTSDKIPGAYKFGDGAFCKLVATFGIDGLEAMRDLLASGRLQELAEDVSDLPALQHIIDSQDNVYASWRAATLYPKRVNTLQRPLEWCAGMVKQWRDLPEDARVEELRRFYGSSVLVHAGNYDAVKAKVAPLLADSPFVALDIETSVPEESLDWLEQTRSKGGSGVAVDVLGSKLTGLSLTFGDNLQYTLYATVDHREEGGVRNITSEQCRELVEGVPQEAHIVIQNRAFEFPVLWQEWGQAWRGNGWYGFVPNTIDTKVEASYVDENLPLGLKQRSAHHLGYQQQTYEETTTLRGWEGSLPAGGRRLHAEERASDDGPAGVWETRQYQMNELTAAHVFGYGCDDTICTAALHTFYRIVMEMEGTWHTSLRVEQLPEYLTSLAFVQGVPVNLGKLRSMENEDRQSLAQHEATLHNYLTESGWEGTQCPEFNELTPDAIKQAVSAVLGDTPEGTPFTTRKRKPEAIALEIESAWSGSVLAEQLAALVKAGDVTRVNRLVQQHFTGKPHINFGSPKHMQRLLYEVIGIEPRVFNKLTDKQRLDDEFRNAFYARRDYEQGKLGRAPTEYERGVWLSKVSTDDEAVELALFRDNLTEQQKGVLGSYLKIKEINTRINLFYNTYSVIPHWKTGRIHSSMNQCQTATRRYSSTNPNLQQLPSRGDGLKFRTLLPAPKDWVYVSLDFNGQELRLMAELSQDAGMLSCYVGDELKDNHSLIAVRAAPLLWGEEVTYEQFMAMRKSDDPEVAERANDLRRNSKTVNFASQYGAQAPKLAIALKTTEEVAQRFLDAKDAAFPGINRWKSEVEHQAEETGLAHTLLGVPRHLAPALLSPNSWVRSKAARQASNFCVQGSGAEQAKLAMSRMWQSGMFTGALRARFVAPIHDEVVFMAHRDDAVEAIRLAHACMTAPYAGMRVPTVSAIAVGLDFSCPMEVGESFYAEQVRAAVDALFTSSTEHAEEP